MGHPICAIDDMSEGTPFKTFTIVVSLPPLDMDDHITIVRQRLQNQMVPSAPQAHTMPSMCIFHNQPHQTASPTPPKKNTPSENWDLQVMALLRITNVPAIENMSEIWHTPTPLTKEKAIPSLEISCREIARALICKAPRVTHTATVLLLDLHFYTEDPNLSMKQSTSSSYLTPPSL